MDYPKQRFQISAKRTPSTLVWRTETARQPSIQKKVKSSEKKSIPRTAFHIGALSCSRTWHVGPLLSRPDDGTFIQSSDLLGASQNTGSFKLYPHSTLPRPVIKPYFA